MRNYFFLDSLGTEESGWFLFDLQIESEMILQIYFWAVNGLYFQKKPLFSMLLSRDVKILSQKNADVFRLKFDVKMGNFLCPHNLDFL